MKIATPETYALNFALEKLLLKLGDKDLMSLFFVLSEIKGHSLDQTLSKEQREAVSAIADNLFNLAQKRGLQG